MERKRFLRAAAAISATAARPAEADLVPGKPKRPSASSHRSAAAADLAARVPGAGIAPYGRPSSYASTIVRTPPGASEIAVTPLGKQLGTITPNGLFFARCHAGVPTLDPRTHSLVISGLVARPLEFSIADIMRFPSVARTHFIECAGNTSGEWQLARAASIAETHGLVSCAEWTGVPLRTLLERVQVSAEARWAVAEGADAGRYDRSIPIEKLMDDALVVYGQNGELLRPEQGFPLRLLLPGYEGSTNVKWLRRLTFGRTPAYSREETAEYTELLPGGKARAFTFVMDAKSVITWPSAGDRLAGPGAYEIRGFAWSGRGSITRLEVSTDGGATWVDAALQAPILAKSFTRFTSPFAWDGRPAVLLSRATDDTGYVQPAHKALVAARGFFSEYHNNAIQPWRIAADGRLSDARE